MKAPEPIAVYFRVTGALFALLALTVGLAFVDMGPFNIVVAMTIAFVKALLVVLFFMHVKYSSKLVMLFAAAGVFWLAILFMFTLSDFLTR